MTIVSSHVTLRRAQPTIMSSPASGIETQTHSCNAVEVYIGCGMHTPEIKDAPLITSNEDTFSCPESVQNREVPSYNFI